MELREMVAGEEVIVKPLPDTHPEVEVTLVRLTTAEVQDVWTQCGIRPDPKLQTWAQWTKATKIIIRREVKSWKGFTENGKELPCNDQTKMRLLDRMLRITNVETGEEMRRPLWRLINDALDKTDEEEEKN